MIWLAWRQFRAAALMTALALGALAAVLAMSRTTLGDEYAQGLAACGELGDCERFMDRFFDEHQTPFLGVTAVALALPALVGLFWGAPLITRELEAGTHLLVWSQSITRTRWLAVKLALLGGAAAVTGGLGSLAVSWWAADLDRAAVEFPLMGPLVFMGRGIVPIGYAAFAFALGVTVGMLVRRPLPAMALTLALFTAVQIAMPLLVRPHLLPPARSSFALIPENVDQLLRGQEGALMVALATRVPGDPGAWTLSSRLVGPPGSVTFTARTGDQALPDETFVPVPTASGPCSLEAQPVARPAQSRDTCLDEINRRGYRQEVTYLPSTRFWPLQWLETGLYAVLTLGLMGLCLRLIRQL
ncbi:ABC transporter permease subunit [Nonomuraea sp. PA05]|uniref:ABC transporter permease subunit n=1 Tax=Nonomuraea sp. PA05 TaxID=2604466 RepID=UPI0011D4AF46|nr:ABC transporter permease subunit [Nonomuraea sp. PA05]TYB50108.1 ABC transporter permease subunit [Nonomuraea sp. PA05]